MQNFIDKFKKTSYYQELFSNSSSEILCIYIGGSRGFGTSHELSDYDITIITLNGNFNDALKSSYLLYKNKKVHWYYVPISFLFLGDYSDIYYCFANLTLNSINDNNIIYKNPRYEDMLNKLLKIAPALSTITSYKIYNEVHVSDILNKNKILPEHINKPLYFLCLASYYLLDEQLDTDFLAAVNISKHTKTLSEEHEKKVIERLSLCKDYIEQHPISIENSLRELYDKFKADTSIEEKYLCKYNFGNDYRIWNPWIGCFKITEACDNCYVKPENCFKDCYYPFPHSDAKVGTFVTVCLRSDFFLEQADKYRPQVWKTIKENPDLIFLIITKRANRIAECLPDDWGNGYNNVVLCVTAENQQRADERIPILIDLPAKHKWITCSPLLEPMQLSTYLASGEIEHVEVTGERNCSKLARPTQYDWVKDIREQCAEYDVRFSLLYLGHNFIMPDGEILKEWAKWYRCKIADSLDLAYYKPITFELKNSNVTY